MKNINFQQSPNFHKGRFAKISTLVIHTMDGYFEGTIETFLKPANQVSAHYLIGQEGQLLQMVQECDTAWHVCNANPFCIGIELEDKLQAIKGFQWATFALWEKLVVLAGDICTRNKIAMANVIGHCDPFLRKYGNNHVDPYYQFFPMADLRADIKDQMSGLTPNSKTWQMLKSLPVTPPDGQSLMLGVESNVATGGVKISKRKSQKS